MSRSALTHEQYLQELNTRLRAHPQYELGMLFKAAPDITTGSNRGFEWEAPPDKEAVMRAIENTLAQQVEIKTA